ncbi:MAG TPA: hypothetical protein VET87_04475 [Rubrivivax sp.]|nr:hypothetical protein [Rubrivivax sp.]
MLQPMLGRGGFLLKASVEVSSSQPRSQAWRMPRGGSIAIPWHATHLEPGRIARIYKLESSCVKGDR